MPSENGWNPAWVHESEAPWVRVPGTDPPVTLRLLRGDASTIMAAHAADWNAYVEKLRDADTAAYTATNSVSTSNHLNATAKDSNWRDHPFHAKGTFNAAQMAAIREIEAFYTYDGLKLVFWAGDWRSPIDEMHTQLGYGTYGDPRLGRFIAERIRADGFSTFRRGGTPRGGGGAVPPTAASGGLTVEVLATIMGNRVSMDRYAQLHPHVLKGLRIAECNTVKRRAFWFGQVGHESGGLKYQEEIASGAAYNGRRDLGNTQPGDGPRFKGRDFIQITGRGNYTALSRWAYEHGLVSSPTFYVDNPTALATDEHAFIGVTWYWTVARPMNGYADRDDFVGATKAVNGGTNGLDDRRAFLARALAAGDALLDPINYDDLEDDMTQETSRSIYRTSNAKTMTAADAARGADATAHMNWVEQSALRGEAWAIGLVRQTALGQGPGATAWWEVNADDTTPAVDPWAVEHALNVLKYIEATNPAALQAYIDGKNPA